MTDDRAALAALSRWAMVGDLNDRHMDVRPDGDYVKWMDVRRALALPPDPERLLTATAHHHAADELDGDNPWWMCACDEPEQHVAAIIAAWPSE